MQDRGQKDTWKKLGESRQGVLRVRHSLRMQPSAYTSAFSSSRAPLNCSGAIYLSDCKLSIIFDPGQSEGTSEELATGISSFTGNTSGRRKEKAYMGVPLSFVAVR